MFNLKKKNFLKICFRMYVRLAGDAVLRKACSLIKCMSNLERHLSALEATLTACWGELSKGKLVSECGKSCVSRNRV